MRKYSLIVASVLILLGVACYFVPDWFTPYKERFNLLGTCSSILGIIVVIFQIRHATAIAEATKEKTIVIENQAEIIANHANDTKIAIERSLERTSRIITIAEASQIVHLPNEIQDALQNGDLGRAYEKMRHLKDELTELKAAPQFQVEKVSTELTKYIGEMNVRLKAISKAIQESKEKMYAQDKTIELMENIRTFLRYQSTIMKRQNIE